MSSPPTATRSPSRTYRGASDAGAPRLIGLPGVRSVDISVPQVLELERYDTDDRRLAAAGIALAVRRGGTEPAQWHLELPDGDDTERLHVPVRPDDGPEVPAQLDELLHGASRERAVRPVGRVRSVRTESRLLGTDDRLLAFVLHDDVTLATFGRTTHVDAWTEVVVHRAEADDALLDELGERFAEIGMRPASRAGEAELDRLLAPARTTRAAGPKGSAGAVLLGYLGKHAERLAAQDLRVRRGEPDSVHQLRVASRRLRSALQAYRPLLDRERTDPVADALGDLGRALAPARDAEVLAARIGAELAALPPSDLLGAVQAFTTRHFARTEAEAVAGALTALDGEAYMQLRRDLDALLDAPPLTPRAARPACTELPRHVGRAARRLRKAVDAAGLADDRAVAVHTARKAGKRVRYATEVARPAAGRPAKRFAKGLKGFQTALGEHQDTVVAREALRRLGGLAHVEGENGFSLGILHGHDAARAAAIEADLPRLWKKAWRRKHRSWLA